MQNLAGHYLALDFAGSSPGMARRPIWLFHLGLTLDRLAIIGVTLTVLALAGLSGLGPSPPIAIALVA